MAEFEMKRWLDTNVVPLLQGPPRLHIYSFIWTQAPGAPHPGEILVWLRTGPDAGVDRTVPCSCEAIVHNTGCTPAEAEKDCPAHQNPPAPFNPADWPRAVKRLLDEAGFRFDYLREQMLVALEGGTIKIFGGDGAPLYNEQGMASCRLFKKLDDGIGLILQVGCQYPAGEDAVQATKSFYQQFDESPLVVTQKYGALFGQA